MAERPVDEIRLCASRELHWPPLGSPTRLNLSSPTLERTSFTFRNGEAELQGEALFLIMSVLPGGVSMTRSTVAAWAIVWVAAFEIATPALALSPPTTPAVWTPHAILVDLENLPKSYTCDELWYKFRAVLLSIGARPSVTITPFYCDGRSPSVELQFSIPQALQDKQTQFADLEASDNIITLEPGHPKPLDSGDCELLRQITEGLFPDLPLHLMSFRLACYVPQKKHTHFQVTVKALTPESQLPATAIATSGARSHTDTTRAVFRSVPDRP